MELELPWFAKAAIGRNDQNIFVYTHFIALRILSHRELRSNNDFLIAQQTTYENSIQYAMIRNWNSLPYDIRSLTSLDTFKSKLKTFYFNAAFPT